jgi:hypothetical protein
MKFGNLAFFVVALTALSSCSQDVTGVYYNEADPTERLQFMKNGKMLVHASGNVAD